MVSASYGARSETPIPYWPMGARSRTRLPTVGALALALCTGACASSGGATPRPFPGARVPRPPATAAVPPDESPAPLPPSAPSPDAAAAALVATALHLLGVPYQNGGTTSDGFDCSGFTQYVFAQHGIALPREVRDQFHVGVPVEAADLSAGDLLFFATTEPGASHVAILIGSDEFVHAPSSTGVVRVERLGSSYWSQRFLGARRVTQP